MKNKIKLGQKVRCKVTGYEGTATHRIEYLNGCIQYGLTPSMIEKGKYPERITVDEESLEVIKEEKVKVKPSKSGGPSMDLKTFKGIR